MTSNFETIFKDFNLNATDAEYQAQLKTLKEKLAGETHAKLLLLDFLFNNHSEKPLAQTRLEELSNSAQQLQLHYTSLLKYIPTQPLKEFFSFLLKNGIPLNELWITATSSEGLGLNRTTFATEKYAMLEAAIEADINIKKWAPYNFTIGTFEALVKLGFDVNSLLKNALELKSQNDILGGHKLSFPDINYTTQCFKIAYDSDHEIDFVKLGKATFDPLFVSFLITNYVFDKQALLNGIISIPSHHQDSNNPLRIESIELLIRNEASANEVDDNGNTLLFSVNNPQIAEFLIANGADYKAQNKNGLSWIASKRIDIVKFALAGKYIPNDISADVKYFFLQGHYDIAKALYDHQPSIHTQLNEDFSISIQTALQNSVEPNKHHALLNLMKMIGIEIPTEFSHLVYNPSDHIEPREFSFLKNNYHKLAEYYLKFAEHNFKTSLEKTCSDSSVPQITSHAFSPNNENAFADFEKLKAICPESKMLGKIKDSYDANYETLGGALNLMDTDFATMVTTINDLSPFPLTEDLTVYRGLGSTLNEEEITSWFEVGHKASIKYHNTQKLFNYFINRDWNKASAMNENGGTYVSVSPSVATNFAGVTNANLNSYILEIKLNKGSPAICGSKMYLIDRELVPSNIDGENIVAIYKLEKQISTNISITNSTIAKVIKNPNLPDAKPNFETGHVFSAHTFSARTTESAPLDAIFDNLKCKEFIESHEHKDYDSFTQSFTHFDSILAHAKVYEDFFSMRPDFSNPFALVSNCNMEVQCCA